MNENEYPARYDISMELKKKYPKLWHVKVMEWVKSSKIHKLGLYQWMILHKDEFHE